VPENLAQKECPGRGTPPSAVPAAACAAIQELGAVAGTAGARTGREAIFGTGSGVCEEMAASRTEGLSMHSHGHGRKGMFGETYPSPWRDPRCATRMSYIYGYS
jgi:PAB1-binding protein PBP1